MLLLRRSLRQRGQQPQGQKKGGGGGGAGGGWISNADEVHQALNDMLNEQGPEGMAALAKLAEQAGMPGDAPRTAEHVRVRVLATHRPAPDATPVPPDLEDAYLAVVHRSRAEAGS